MPHLPQNLDLTLCYYSRLVSVLGTWNLTWVDTSFLWCGVWKKGHITRDWSRNSAQGLGSSGNEWCRGGLEGNTFFQEVHFILSVVLFFAWTKWRFGRFLESSALFWKVLPPVKEIKTISNKCDHVPSAINVTILVEPEHFSPSNFRSLLSHIFATTQCEEWV